VQDAVVGRRTVFSASCINARAACGNQLKRWVISCGPHAFVRAYEGTRELGHTITMPQPCRQALQNTEKDCSAVTIDWTLFCT
jgi:hypothetical protein